jgi:hypothetical protein
VRRRSATGAGHGRLARAATASATRDRR